MVRPDTLWAWGQGSDLSGAWRAWWRRWPVVSGRGGGARRQGSGRGAGARSAGPGCEAGAGGGGEGGETTFSGAVRGAGAYLEVEEPGAGSLLGGQGGRGELEAGGTPLTFDPGRTRRPPNTEVRSSTHPPPDTEVRSSTRRPPGH